MELLLYHYPILGLGLETQTGVFGSEIQDHPHIRGTDELMQKLYIVSLLQMSFQSEKK